LSYIPRYDKGDWIADCDVCGRKYKASQLTQRWDGLMCCDDDWEIRQPQDFVRGVPDTQIAPWLRPEPADQFITFAFVAPPVLIPVTETVTLTTLVFPDPTRSDTLINGAALNTKTLG
jgi:hypothetical protein